MRTESPLPNLVDEFKLQDSIMHQETGVSARQDPLLRELAVLACLKCISVEQLRGPDHENLLKHLISQGPPSTKQKCRQIRDHIERGVQQERKRRSDVADAMIVGGWRKAGATGVAYIS